jgi:hypothetical protein
MLDQRSLAEKSADLELEIVQGELAAWGLELHGEGLGELEILGCIIEQLEERLAHLYRELYEIGEE